MKKLYYHLLTLLMVFFVQGLFAQSVTVTGVVKSNSDNLPLPGVSVQIQGTVTGNITDFDGKYEVKAEIGSKLQFSSVGMKTVIKTVESDKLDVTLEEDILGLDEIVVTGTSGLTTKKQLGSSISAVSSKDLSASKANVSIDEALQGRVAGAKIVRNSGDPSGGISVVLRGNSTLAGSSEPLYIVDGVIINNKSNSLVNLGGNTQNRIVDINPSDIESMEILKGAAAAAIYGSRASNGVIQIFTKRGKTGKPTINYSTSVNFNSIREYLPYNNSQLKWEQVGTTWNAVPATRYNYQDYIFQKSTGYENNLSISGKKDNTGYSFSLSQYDNEGIVKNTDYSRKTARLRLDQKLFEWMDLSLGTFFSKSHSNDMPNGTEYGPITSLLFVDNIQNLAPVDGIYPSEMDGWANPYEVIDRVKASQEYYRFINDIQVKIRPFEGATLNYTFGMDNTNGVGLLNIPNGFNSIPDGAAEKNTDRSMMYNSDINFSYAFDITNDLKSSSSVGYSYQYDEYDFFSMRNNKVGPIESVTVVSPASVSGGADYRTQRSVWGGFMQQTFGYKDQLFLTLAGRSDGASTFGADERQQFYPKVSASYNISDASFWNDGIKKAVNSLKLRSAWGQAGNLTALSPYQIYTNYSQGVYSGLVGYFPNTLQGSANLKPERQTELEVGFDMALFNDRIGIEFTYYDQKVEDLLIAHSLSPSTGFAKRYDNIGSMTNKGVEVLLKAKPIKGDFNWDVTTTFSKNKNNLTHVAGGKLDMPMFWGASVAITDHAIGAIYGTYYATDSNGNRLMDVNGFPQRAKGHYEVTTLSDGESYNVGVQDYDANGQPTGTVLKKVVGDPNPDFTGSLINSFKYKNFGLSIQLDFVKGNDILNWDKRMGELYKGGYYEGQELSDPNVPKDYNNTSYYIYESFVEDGSFVKLREVALSYELKVNKPYLNRINFTLSGNNLISWDNYWGFDPEINTGGQTNGVMGQQMASVPIPRTFKLGVNFNF
ncbi:MAG: hypothetical protein A3F91_04575 [Flavobacteria bacterium RIFCSPLOWO2_12_FULL_35_11]|nr:MAG: hypothetical protein A3F91_04575 [Flavobacteria bacterium RIFCSPLOWO2_12_FULL_35_11]